MAWSHALKEDKGEQKHLGSSEHGGGYLTPGILQRQRVTPCPVTDFLPVAWYLCLTANPSEEHVWTGARAFNISQNCALTALKVSFSFSVVARNINGKSRTQANGKDMAVGQACQQSLPRRVDHSRAAGVAAGQPLLPR